MTQGTLNLDAPREEERTRSLRIGEREVSITLRYVDGEAQPSEPENPAYMRGWNAAAKQR